MFKRSATTNTDNNAMYLFCLLMQERLLGVPAQRCLSRLPFPRSSDFPWDFPYFSSDKWAGLEAS